MRLSLGRLPQLKRASSLDVVCSVDRFSRRCLSDFEKKATKGSFSKQFQKQSSESASDGQFLKKPIFSDRVRDIVPLAVERHLQRPKKDKYETVDPRNPRNKIVTNKDGERQIKKGKRLLPLYRDWEKEFGKPIGDSRPYYRRNMGPLLMPYRERPKLEKMTSLIVVEGLKDLDAIRSAVDAQVFVCDGASILSHVYERYVKRTVGVYQGDIILLMDPDTAGRRMRTSVNTLMEPCKHAFISEYDAVVGMGTLHESIGIENASPECIRHALKHTKSFERDREMLFPFDVLYEMGLVQTPAERIEGVRLRRRFACGFLGIGFCDGKQLMKQLNGYGFSWDEVKDAVDKANILLEEWKHHPWRLQKDYARSPRRPGLLYTIPSQYMEAF